MRYVSATLAIVGVLSGTQDVLADESRSAQMLPEIVVTAREVPGSANLSREIDRATIDAWNARTAAEVLVQTPGVNVQYGGSSGDARLWMRGFRDRDVLVLFDGIPIATAFEGRIDLNEVSLESVTSVRVTKGAPSVIYGANGMGGVVDIVPQPGRWPQGLSATFEAGENDTHHVRAGYTGGTQSLKYRLSGSYDHTDGFDVSDDFASTINQAGTQRTNADQIRKNIFGYVSGTSEFLGETSLFYASSDNERGLAPETGTTDADFERLTQSDRRTIGLSNQFEAIPLSVKVFHNSYDSELTIYTDSSYGNVDEIEDAREDSWGAMAYSSVTAGERHLFVFGASAVHDEFESAGALAGVDEARMRTFTLSVEDHIQVGKLVVSPGLIASRFDQREDNRQIDVINPQVILDYTLTDWVSLHASAAERTRFPKLRELYQRRRGNPNLDEQTARNYQLGAAFRLDDRWLMDFTLFRSSVEDLIERPNRSSTYLNLPDVEFEGVELSMQNWVSDDIFMRVAYTWLDASERAPGGGERQLRSRAEHSAYAEVRANLPLGLKLSLNGVFSDGLHDLDGDSVHVELPDSLVWHAKLAKKVAEGVSVYVSLANVTDEEYYHRLGFPRAGRSARLGVRLEL